jgi:hypothetical protein
MQLVLNMSLRTEQNPAEFKETLACVRSLWKLAGPTEMLNLNMVKKTEGKYLSILCEKNSKNNETEFLVT